MAISLSPRKLQITGASSNIALPRVPKRMHTTGMMMGSREMNRDGCFLPEGWLFRADTSSAVTLELWFTSFASFQMPISWILMNRKSDTSTVMKPTTRPTISMIPRSKPKMSAAARGLGVGGTTRWAVVAPMVRQPVT